MSAKSYEFCNKQRKTNPIWISLNDRLLHQEMCYMISWYIYRWRPIKSDLERKNKKNKKTLKKVLTYVFWFGIINKSSRETHKTTTTEYVMERYRSGHNEAVLKTVCPKGRVGSNPTLSVFYGEVPKLAEGAPLERE